ncbi:hypothetical protein Q8F55_004454 [Vanrija albida]|uniref:HPP transmembrane region domain-containing protein n=1 Tax=Vanrija albida TaxID=181172 RepID=A0ABR3Q6Z1_9TREE
MVAWPSRSRRATTKEEALPPPATQPTPPSSDATLTPLLSFERDLRTLLPPQLRRFLGYRELDASGADVPSLPLQFPPFSWLGALSPAHEVWLLSFLGSFVGIALVEIVNATAFPDRGVPLIIASFGATAVLVYGTSDSPLAQPRHVLGGHIISAVLSVGVTRLFRHATGYHLTLTAETGALRHVVWLNGAMCMALSLLAMQITGTVHPPGGATALIAAVNEDAVELSWRYIYLVLISALLMTGWALFINNVGRRRYPTYWLHGKRLFVATPDGKDEERYEDDVQMAAEQGSGFGFRDLSRALSRETQLARVRSSPLSAWAEGEGSPELEVVRTPSASPHRGRSARRERTPRLASAPPLSRGVSAASGGTGGKR